jgi:diguanylate cyclase (GGDEF)-like protein
LQVLAEVLSAFSVDDPDAIDRVVDRIAESVDAEVVMLVRRGRVAASVGVTDAARADLVAAAGTRPILMHLAGFGPHDDTALSVCWSPLDGDDVVAVGRFGEPFDLEERSLLRAIGRSLALSFRALDALDAERLARDELDRALAVATHRATHDQLTGLPARELVIEALDRRLLGASPLELERTFVFFLDVDRFKQVNDVHGHAIGDEFLVALAHRLRAAAGTGDLCGRLAGDEFALVSSQVSLESAEAKAAELLRVLVDPLEIDGRSIVPSISIGLARAAPGDLAETLVDDADLAMYRAKQTGRGRVVVFDPALREATEQRAGIEADLRQALRGPGEFVPYFQPVVDLGARRIVGFEALVRWLHPTQGVIPPDLFVPVAEDTGQIVHIDARMLRSACARLAEWRRIPGMGRLTISVNTSARSFSDPLLPSRVAEALDLAGLSAEALLLELTESVMMDEGSGDSETVQHLVDLGVRLAVDDFGTGYSSLRYLREFPVAVLKVDRSFTSQLGEDREVEVIVESIVGMARSLGLAVTAEGVETEAQAERLVDLGCGYAQGYLYGRPVDAETATGVLLDQADVSA